jgi:hypothetical protein
MEDKVRNVSQMMTREREKQEKKNIRGSIIARERLLRTVLRSITRPISNVSIMTKMVTMLVNAMSPVRYG